MLALAVLLAVQSAICGRPATVDVSSVRNTSLNDDPPSRLTYWITTSRYVETAPEARVTVTNRAIVESMATAAIR
jgi:hypothetical protein